MREGNGDEVALVCGLWESKIRRGGKSAALRLRMMLRKSNPRCDSLVSLDSSRERILCANLTYWTDEENDLTSFRIHSDFVPILNG